MSYVPPQPPGEFSLPMTPERINWCLAVLGWSRNELARRLSIAETTAAQMMRGNRDTPHRVGVWLETLAQMMLALPTPFLWSDASGVGRQRQLGGFGPQVEAMEAAWDVPEVLNSFDELREELDALRSPDR
jgi:hypothetical protein